LHLGHTGANSAADRDLMDKVTRRSFVTTVGAASVVPGSALLAPAAEPAETSAISGAAAGSKPTYLFFNAAEAVFVEAACERLIPADDLGPGALGAGAPIFLDRQLGGAWGAGDRLYRSGPWPEGTPSQGYQLPFTPAELFRTSLRAILRDLEARGTPFNDLSGESQDGYLKSLESGAHDLDGVPSAVFFDTFLKMTIEGFFCDPVYGGNRNMAAWRMIGFPGAYADYFDEVDRHNVKYAREPMSLAEDRHGHIEERQDIPARL
jgi:gluconate 2-dehydrogenase gamma chain